MSFNGIQWLNLELTLILAMSPKGVIIFLMYKFSFVFFGKAQYLNI